MAMGEVRGTYEDLYRYLLEEHDVIALGLYRRDREASEQDSGMDAKPVAVGATAGANPQSPMKRGVRKFNQEPSASTINGMTGRTPGLPGSPRKSRSSLQPRSVPSSVPSSAGSLLGGTLGGAMRRTSCPERGSTKALLPVLASADGGIAIAPGQILPRTKSMRSRSLTTQQSAGVEVDSQYALRVSRDSSQSHERLSDTEIAVPMRVLDGAEAPKRASWTSNGGPNATPSLLSDEVIDMPTSRPESHRSQPGASTLPSSAGSGVATGGLSSRRPTLPRPPSTLSLPGEGEHGGGLYDIEGAEDPLSRGSSSCLTTPSSSRPHSAGSHKSTARERAVKMRARALWRTARTALARGMLRVNVFPDSGPNSPRQSSTDADADTPLYPATHLVVITNPPSAWLIEPDDGVFVLLRSSESLLPPVKSGVDLAAAAAAQEPPELHVLGQSTSHRLPNISAFMREREGAPRLGVDEGYIDANTAMLAKLRDMELSLHKKVDMLVATQQKGEERLSTIEGDLGRVSRALAELAEHTLSTARSKGAGSG
jgi:hypothetical protein